MQKIPTLFIRDFDGDRRVRDEVTPGCEWVSEGLGISTRKFDGTACLVRGGRLFKRYDAKKGKAAPPDFIPAQPEPDPISLHWPGWVPVGDGPEDRYHREAWERGYAIAEGAGSFGRVTDLEDGTYELCGPKIQGNKDGLTGHYLVAHGEACLADAPRDFEGLRRYFEEHPKIEGIVWHHPDGRMVKLKRRDYGLPWGGHA